ncbi:SEC14 cytosolic factor [Linum perenne]
MENANEMAIAQMRKSVEKLGSTTEKHGDQTLNRFLIARSMNTDKAAEMFVQWQKWRESFVPNGFISDSEVPDELAAKKIYLQVSKHYPSKDQLQFKKFIVHLLDKTIASSFNGRRERGNEKLVAVLDLHQLAYKNVDIRGLITGFQFLQAYYPERLHKLYILNMPRFFVSVWRIVSRFLEKATLDKIMIVKNEKEMREFVREVGEETLPEEYGGRTKLVAIQDVTLPPLVD